MLHTDTSISEVEDCFKRFLKRDDIDIILINQNVSSTEWIDLVFFSPFPKIIQVAEMIRHVIDNHNEPIPAVLEIPSKDHPYDASKDSILRRAKVWGIFFKSNKWSQIQLFLFVDIQGMFSAEDAK